MHALTLGVVPCCCPPVVCVWWGEEGDAGPWNGVAGEAVMDSIKASKVFDHQSKNDICKDVDENFSDQN